MNRKGNIASDTTQHYLSEFKGETTGTTRRGGEKTK